MLSLSRHSLPSADRWVTITFRSGFPLSMPEGVTMARIFGITLVSDR